MFILFGTRVRDVMMGMVTFVCGFCGNSAQQRIVKRVLKLTLFFVPTVPLSVKYRVDCSVCGGSTSLTRAQVDRGLASSTAVIGS